MKVAFACWDNRIAPVFDTARHVHILHIHNGSIQSESHETLPDVQPQKKIVHLAERGVDTLVCGAISRPLYRMLVAGGIQVVPFLAGELQEIVQAFLKDALPNEHYLMPGCCGRGWGVSGNAAEGFPGGLGRGAGAGRGMGRGGGRGQGGRLRNSLSSGTGVGTGNGRGHRGGRNQGDF